MYEAAEALRDAMLALGLACDGGKDSVSMVARAGDEVQLPLVPMSASCFIAPSRLIPVLESGPAAASGLGRHAGSVHDTRLGCTMLA